MLSSFIYLLAFIVGAFLVWHLGRKRFYDEENLIDLVVFSTVVGLLGGWLVALAITSNFSIIATKGFAAWQGFHFSTPWSVGINWLAAMASTILFVIYYLRRLRWPLWPPLGFLAVGASAAWLLATLISSFFTFNFLSLIFPTLTFGSIFYIVERGGEQNLKDFAQGFRMTINAKFKHPTKTGGGSEED